MEKKKIFISMPMRGKSRDGLFRERKTILDELPSLLDIDGCMEIPMLPELVTAMNGPAHCLGLSIQDLSHADVAVFAPGWRDARGCVVEHAVCLMYRIPYVELMNCDGGYSIAKDGRNGFNDDDKEG